MHEAGRKRLSVSAVVRDWQRGGKGEGSVKASSLSWKLCPCGLILNHGFSSCRQARPEVNSRQSGGGHTRDLHPWLLMVFAFDQALDAQGLRRWTFSFQTHTKRKHRQTNLVACVIITTSRLEHGKWDMSLSHRLAKIAR